MVVVILEFIESSLILSKCHQVNMYEIRYHILLMIEKVIQERIDENLVEEDHQCKIRFYFLFLLMNNNMKFMRMENKLSHETDWL